MSTVRGSLTQFNTRPPATRGCASGYLSTGTDVGISRRCPRPVFTRPRRGNDPGARRRTRDAHHTGHKRGHHATNCDSALRKPEARPPRQTTSDTRGTGRGAGRAVEEGLAHPWAPRGRAQAQRRRRERRPAPELRASDPDWLMPRTHCRPHIFGVELDCSDVFIKTRVWGVVRPRWEGPGTLPGARVALGRQRGVPRGLVPPQMSAAPRSRKREPPALEVTADHRSVPGLPRTPPLRHVCQAKPGPRSGLRPRIRSGTRSAPERPRPRSHAAPAAAETSRRCGLPGLRSHWPPATLPMDPPAAPRPPHPLRELAGPALGSTSWVPDAGLPFLLLLLPLDLGLEALDLPAQVGDDVRVLGDVVGHAQQVALDLRGQDTGQGQARGAAPQDTPDSDPLHQKHPDTCHGNSS